MSIIVSVKINDGVVMAADSATTFFKPTGEAGQIYQNADKIVNLVKALPVGVMTCGAGSVGTASIVTLLKDLRRRFSGLDKENRDWKIDAENYTMEQVAGRVNEFFQEKANEADFKWFLLLRICGYSSGRDSPEVWQVAFLDEGKHLDPACIQPEVLSR